MNEHIDKSHSGLEEVVGTEGQGMMHVINFLGFIKKTLGGTTQTRHQILLYLKCFVAATKYFSTSCLTKLVLRGIFFFCI